MIDHRFPYTTWFSRSRPKFKALTFIVRINSVTLQDVCGVWRAGGRTVRRLKMQRCYIVQSTTVGSDSWAK